MTTRTLIILDGVGIRQARESNAFAAANKPTFDGLLERFAHSQIETSGRAVGLPEGQMGNSEVGHMNLGAGRVVYQSLTRIDKAIEEGAFARNPALLKLVGTAKQRGGAVHIMGLLSEGGVHSHIEHVVAACKCLAGLGVENIYVHGFLDGRDTPPRSAAGALGVLERELQRLGAGRIVSLVGRYYAMDRDNRWSRIESAYRLIVSASADHHAATASEALADAYQRGESDEFVKAVTVGQPVPFGTDDVMMFMNFRPDRARQLSQALIDPRFDAFERPWVLGKDRLLTLTSYSQDLDCLCAFAPEAISNCLGEYIAGLGKKQLRIAETEKYAHVTFFFNGGTEQPFEGETRILIPSPNVASYDLQPEMSAPLLTDRLVDAIAGNRFDLIVCNYANGDMVGHTGSFDAAVAAVEVLDDCLRRVVEATLAAGGECLITADHGNVEQMLDERSGQAHTAHTLNPVPLILVSEQPGRTRLRDGRLADVAPTLLAMLGLPIPSEMTGSSLLIDPNAQRD